MSTPVEVQSFSGLRAVLTANPALVELARQQLDAEHLDARRARVIAVEALAGDDAWRGGNKNALEHLEALSPDVAERAWAAVEAGRLFSPGPPLVWVEPHEAGERLVGCAPGDTIFVVFESPARLLVWLRSLTSAR